MLEIKKIMQTADGDKEVLTNSKSLNYFQCMYYILN